MGTLQSRATSSISSEQVAINVDEEDVGYESNSSSYLASGFSDAWNISNVASGVLEKVVTGQSEHTHHSDEIPPPDEEHSIGFGVKSIGFFGGLALLINNITGPGLVDLPVVYQEAGWLIPSIFMIFIMIMGTFSATMLCKAMSTIPGNERFNGRLELSTLAKIYFPRWGYYITVLLLISSLYATIISSIIVSAQTMDFALVRIFHYTGGIEVYPHPGWAHATESGDGVSPFGDSYLLSMGYVIVLILSIPAGYLNLDDNIIIQIGAFFSLMVVVIIWLINCFAVKSLDVNRVPAYGTSTTDFATLMGTIIFNYGFVTSVPSWVNEKKEKVGVNKSLWSASIYSTSLFIALGIIGGMAFDYSSGDDLLDGLNDESTHKGLKILAQITVYLFPIVALLTSIPVFSIIIRYNLLESNWCKRKSIANFWAVLFPWLLTLPFYTGNGLTDVINWFGLVVFGIINFTIPLWLYVQAVRKTPDNIEIHHLTTVKHKDIHWERHPTNYEPHGDFHAIPPYIQRVLRPKPVAVAFIIILTGFIIANLIFDFVEIGLGNDVVDS